MSRGSLNRPTPAQIDAALSESAVAPAPIPPAPNQRPTPVGSVFPRSDLHCAECREPLVFETDTNGCAVERCACGRRFVQVQWNVPPRGKRTPRPHLA